MVACPSQAGMCHTTPHHLSTGRLCPGPSPVHGSSGLRVPTPAPQLASTLPASPSFSPPTGPLGLAGLAPSARVVQALRRVTGWVGAVCPSGGGGQPPPPTVSHPGDGRVKWALLQTWEECVVVSKHLRSRSGSSWKEPACQGRARPPRPSKAPPSPPRSLGKAQEVDPPAPIICGL